MLDSDNYRKGFLIDPELMAGITEDPNAPGHFFAFVLKHETGEYLGYQRYPGLQDALIAINQIPRKWNYETTSGCGGGKCGSGNCGVGSDGKSGCGQVCKTGNC